MTVTVADSLKPAAEIGWTSHKFILEHGRDFTPAALPKRYKLGEPKRCFMNAAKLAQRTRLSYVEGYALKPSLLPDFPFEHAWCVDAKGRVVDPTWDDVCECLYRGVIIPADDLRRELLRLRHWGALFTVRGFNTELAERLAVLENLPERTTS